MVALATEAVPTLWIIPTAPGGGYQLTQKELRRKSARPDTAGKKLSILTTFTSVQQALKKDIITVFEPMYLDVLNDDMVGFANIIDRAMLDHLFMAYGNITAVDLENNFEQMRRAWDPHQPVESLFKQIQDCDDYSESGGVLIEHPQQINVCYAHIFATGHLMSACYRWNEKPSVEKTWAQFKTHFAEAHRQHKQMQGESAASSDYHSEDAAMGQTEEQMAEATI
jgi:hypothetical protein